MGAETNKNDVIKSILAFAEEEAEDLYQFWLIVCRLLPGDRHARSRRRRGSVLQGNANNGILGHD